MNLRPMVKFALLCCISMLLSPVYAASWKPGAEVVSLATLKRLSGTVTRIGLITNQTGITRNGQRTVDLLLKKNFPIKKIFVPEHGLTGTIQAEKKVDNSIDLSTKIPIISLYAGHGPHTLRPEDLADLDLLIVDMQDSGMRHYTYLSTLFNLLQAAAHNDKKIMVLDRPNPLGAVMEGPLVDPALISFISIAPIPVRHGMTLGELALYFNSHVLPKAAPLSIVPVQSYDRTKGIDHCWLAPLSPNINNEQACFCYSFLGILSEIGPFDVGVGTPQAFSCLMLPDQLALTPKKWIVLSLKLAQHHIPSFAYRYFNERKKKWFTGLRLKIKDINQVPTMATILTIVDFFKQENIKLVFRNIDKATGTPQLREYSEGKITRHTLASNINRQTEQFFEQAQQCFLYKPAPDKNLLL